MRQIVSRSPLGRDRDRRPHALAPYSPLADVLGLTSHSATLLLTLAGITGLYIVSAEFAERVFFRREPTRYRARTSPDRPPTDVRYRRHAIREVRPPRPERAIRPPGRGPGGWPVRVQSTKSRRPTGR